MTAHTRLSLGKFVLLLPLILLSSLVHAEFKLVYFENYPPYSWKENGKMKGILIDVMDAVIKDRLDLNLSHAGYPWARAQMMVKTSEADAFVTVPTPERLTYTQASKEPAIVTTFTAFTAADNPKLAQLQQIDSFDQLKNYQLIQYIGNGWAKQNLSDYHVFWVPTVDKALFLVAENRYDLFIDSTFVVQSNIRRLGFSNKVRPLPYVYDSRPFTLCIGKQSSYIGILLRVEKALAEMKQSGQLQAIYDRYRQVEW